MSVQEMSWVIDRSTQKESAFVVLLMIANHAHADGTGAFMSNETLAREARISARQVRNILPKLVEAGELRIFSSGRGRGRVNQYAVIMGERNREAVERFAEIFAEDERERKMKAERSRKNKWENISYFNKDAENQENRKEFPIKTEENRKDVPILENVKSEISDTENRKLATIPLHPL